MDDEQSSDQPVEDGGDEEARRQRAAEIREEVELLKRGEFAADELPPPTSPREFIERKMREKLGEECDPGAD